jgi:hypothetical protein
MSGRQTKVASVHLLPDCPGLPVFTPIAALFNIDQTGHESLYTLFFKGDIHER